MAFITSHSSSVYDTLFKLERHIKCSENNIFPFTNHVIGMGFDYAAFLDYGYTEAGDVLYNFGKEGVSFDMVDGYPTFNDLMRRIWKCSGKCADFS